MADRIYNILFLCTGNSARSILGEALVNKIGAGRFRGYSAGSFPKGAVHPMALDVLRGLDFETAGLRSKSWSEFAAPDAPQMDFIFTVCDNAAGETCPLWPGQPMTAHWGIEDPAAIEASGAEGAGAQAATTAVNGQRMAFLHALRQLRRRLELFFALPLESIDKLSLANRMQAIGTEQAQLEGSH